MTIYRLLLIGVLFSPCLTLKLDAFGTKTLYKWAHPPMTPVNDELVSFSRDSAVCEAVHVYVVARHGARYPSDGKMEDMPKLFDKIRNRSNTDKFTAFDNWTSRYDIEKESQLVEEGIDELKGLGERFATRFSRLFVNHGSLVKFVSSHKTRASNSSKYFHQGVERHMLNIGANSIGAYVNEINNTLSRFYDDCYNYENGVEDNATHMAEFRKYGNDTFFLDVLDSVSAALGQGARLTQDELYLVYELCAYEKYIYGDELWCGLMSDDQRETLEYGDDLEKYYESGDTAPVITKMTCPLVLDIVHTLNSSRSDTWNYSADSSQFANTGYLAGKFVFGHSETVVPLMTALGLYKDPTPLLASNRLAMKNRLFKTSHIAPFSANVAIAMYSCEDKNNSQIGRSFAVKMFVNEKPVTIPACNSTVCDYEEFVAHYSPITDNCDLETICGSEGDDDNDDDTNGTDHVSGSLLPMILLLKLSALKDMWDRY